MPARTRIPKYRHHKGSGQALVELNKRRIYLGAFGSPESKQRYERLVAEWLMNGRKTPIQAHERITVDEIAAHYLSSLDRDQKYLKPDGSKSTRFGEVKLALRQLCQDHGFMKAEDFSVTDLRVIQHRMMDQKLRVGTINARIATIKRVFKHAATHELVPSTRYESVRLLENIAQGQRPELDSEKVECVCEADIEAILSLVPRPVWGLIQTQLLTAARPGELVQLRARDIQRLPEGCWYADLTHHKTAHHGKQRRLIFGPKAQAVLTEFLPTEKPLDAPVFSAVEAKMQGRMDGSSPSREAPTGKDRIPTGFYRVDSYRRAIRRACKEAGIPPWSPNQLRHNAGTRIRNDHGVEVAQVILGHTTIKTTEIYAEPNHKAATDIMAKLG